MKLANLEKVRGGGADDQPKSIWHGSELCAEAYELAPEFKGKMKASSLISNQDVVSGLLACVGRGTCCDAQ